MSGVDADTAPAVGASRADGEASRAVDAPGVDGEPPRTDGEPDVPARPSSTGVDRAFRWLSVAAIPLTTLLVFRALYKPVSDPDSFWHLRLGSYLLQDWTFRGTEPWSALASRPLVLHEWAPELAYIVAYRVGGFAALSWLQAAGGVVFLVTLYLCARRFAPALVAALTAAAGFVGASGSLALRPQLVSFVLLACVTATWLLTARDARPRWWLVPLTWVWACSHGMWFLGVAVGLVVIVGMALDRRVPLRSAGRLAIVPGLSVVVAAFTPVGPSLLLTAGAMRRYTSFIAEWDSPSLFLTQSLVTVGLAVLIVLVWARAGARTPWTELGLWGLGLALALMYTRTIALGAVILCVLAASVVARHVEVDERRRPSRRLEAAVLAAVSCAVLLLGPTVAATEVSGPGGVPRALDSALDRMPAGTVVFNDYGLGGWLLWAHPDLDPVVDGRADVYDVDHFARTMAAYSVSPGWEATVRDSKAAAALLPPDSPLAAALRTRLGWTTIGEDEGYALLTAPR